MGKALLEVMPLVGGFDAMHGTMLVGLDVQRTIKQAEMWALLHGAQQTKWSSSDLRGQCRREDVCIGLTLWKRTNMGKIVEHLST